MFERQKPNFRLTSMVSLYHYSLKDMWHSPRKNVEAAYERKNCLLGRCWFTKKWAAT